MLNLIYGGSGSGKSEFAEQLSVQLAQQCNGNLYYIATMKPWDKECVERIEKHQMLRAKKHFKTIECYENIDLISFSDTGKNNVALLECLSNLTANEMFSRQSPKRSGLCEKLFSDIITLYKKTTCLIIVSNNIFEDGMDYDSETIEYQKLLGQLNQKIAKSADYVYKITAGIISVY